MIVSISYYSNEGVFVRIVIHATMTLTAMHKRSILDDSMQTLDLIDA